MKNSYIKYGILFLTILCLGSCKKTKLDPEDNNNNSTGQVSFRTNANLGVITVNVNQTSQNISKYYTSDPGCAASGCANFKLEPGNYDFTASATNLNWNGTVTVAADGCSRMQLTGNGGTGGGGTTTNGQITFWTNSDGGIITVNLSGISRTITQYYTSGITACGANGCATFSVSPGSYSYTASSAKKTWNGTVTVASGGSVSCNIPGSYAKMNISEVKIIEDIGFEKRGCYSGTFDAIVYIGNSFF